MKTKFLILILFATVILTSCENSSQDFTEEVPEEKIMLRNPENMVGVYSIIGPHCYTANGETVKAPSLSEGEYKIYFINQNVDGNICTIDGNSPIFYGQTSYTVDFPSSARIINVPIKEISCYIHLNNLKGVLIKKILLRGTSNSIFIDGNFTTENPNMQLVDDCYVIAKKMTMYITIQLEETKKFKTLDTELDAQPEQKYIVNVKEDRIFISSSSM